MSILPAMVESVIGRVPLGINARLQLLLQWFSTYVYAQLLPHANDHLLVRLQAHLDFVPLEEACRAFHHTSGPGAPVMHAVSKLVRALLLSYLFNWSLRQLEIELRFNLLVKWFVGYTLFDTGPDHVTLDRFELWVCLHQPRTFFDTVLTQIDRDFPDERRQVQVGDTFALRADAAKEDLVPLIRHSCQCLLRALLSIAPQRASSIETWLQSAELFGAPDELSAYHLPQPQRAQRLQRTVLAARACAQWAARELDALNALPERARQSVQAWLARLEKLWSDEIVISADAQAQVTRISESKPKGSYRLGSATDPDASYRVHGKNKTDFGYNVQLAVTEDFIREIQANTGAQPDHVSIPDVLAAQQAQHALTPEKFIYDAAAGNGKTRALVDEASAGQTLLVAPLIQQSGVAVRRAEPGQELFKPNMFTLSDDGSTLSCPNGQSADGGFRSERAEGRTFRFYPSKCKDCPLWNACRGPASRPHSLRYVFVSDYRPYSEAAERYNQTDAFKADMKLRPCVERIIAALVRYGGARRARRRGLRKADFQMKMAATAFNLKKWMRRLAEQSDIPFKFAISSQGTSLSSQ